MKTCTRFIACLALAAMVLPARSQGRAKRPAVIAPTHADVVYGSHARNRLDLWLAESAKPTPLLICIHGGGFMGGDKRSYHRNAHLIKSMLDAGISVAAINYRLTEGGKNPYPAPMLDGARAVQFLRANAKQYNLVKDRFAATGGSAGGMMLMWLGFHPDLAQPDSDDPILRESSRLQVLAPNNGPTTVHTPTLAKWFGVKSLTPHPALRPLFGLAGTGPVRITEELEKAMHDASPISHLTADDPPAYLAHGP
ncbi:MAG: alpha/beta hydrolase, partial [Victivallales bacterium]|nr:alpha/beta hydrolase [Victivallales bacterium]